MAPQCVSGQSLTPAHALAFFHLFRPLFLCPDLSRKAGDRKKQAHSTASLEQNDQSHFNYIDLGMALLVEGYGQVLIWSAPTC